MFKESYASLQLVFLVVGAFGLYYLYVTGQAILVGTYTPRNVFDGMLGIVGTLGYLFFGLRIRGLLPTWRDRIIWFIGGLWVIGLVEAVVIYFMTPLEGLAADLPYLVLGLAIQSVIPLYLIWNIKRLASGGVSPHYDKKRSLIYLGIFVAIFAVFAIFLFSLADIP